MSIAASMLGEFDNEMATTRKVLARVPDGDAAWKPHPKSFSMGELASHIADMVAWSQGTLTQPDFDFNPPGGTPYATPAFTTTAELLTAFDSNVAAARAVLEATTDQAMMANWSLKSGGEVLMTMPRIVVLRAFIMNHIIHHRGQLSVYLRIRDIPAPSI